MNEDILKHFGVLGMKWGVRKSRSRVSGSSRDHLRAAKLKSKRLNEMSNDELKALTSRMQLEKQYRDLNPSRTDRGKKSASSALKLLGQLAGGAAAIVTLATSGNKIYEYARKKASGG